MGSKVQGEGFLKQASTSVRWWSAFSWFSFTTLFPRACVAPSEQVQVCRYQCGAGCVADPLKLAVLNTVLCGSVFSG